MKTPDEEFVHYFAAWLAGDRKAQVVGFDPRTTQIVREFAI